MIRNVKLYQWHGVPQGSYSQNMSLVLNLVSGVSILLRDRHIGWPFSGGTAIDLDKQDTASSISSACLGRSLVLLSCALYGSIGIGYLGSGPAAGVLGRLRSRVHGTWGSASSQNLGLESCLGS